LRPTQTFWERHERKVEEAEELLCGSRFERYYEEAVELRPQVAPAPHGEAVDAASDTDALTMMPWYYLGSVALLGEVYDLNADRLWFPGAEGWRVLIAGQVYNPSTQEPPANQ
ncbi:MAG: hypothetical protein ACRD4B_04170, partial [Acidobacteriota bacterium]